MFGVMFLASFSKLIIKLVMVRPDGKGSRHEVYGACAGCVITSSRHPKPQGL